MPHKRDISIWDILAWVAFAIVFLYFFFKIIGVLHSPLTIDLVALISAGYFVGRYASRIDMNASNLRRSIKYLKEVAEDVRHIKEDVHELDKKCPIFKKKGTRTQ